MAAGGNVVSVAKSDLLAQAHAARERAYAPYSRYQVGAALLTSDGQIFTGCNVENTSYGLSVCAERVAVFSVVAAGALSAASITAIAIATQDAGTPCGACLQVLAEFAPAGGTVNVLLASADGSVRETTLSALLPDAFRLRAVPLPGQQQPVSAS
jgi:cytidine deaminase